MDWDLAALEGGTEWTEGHDNEKQFQKDKQNKQMLEAIEYGTMETNDELEAKLEERKKLDAEQDKRLIAERRRQLGLGSHAGLSRHIRKVWPDCSRTMAWW